MTAAAQLLADAAATAADWLAGVAIDWLAGEAITADPASDAGIALSMNNRVLSSTSSSISTQAPRAGEELAE